MMRPGGEIIGGTKCQNCGNQAKRECLFMRCRACCKSKGFHCQTHVKSTWVPVHRRRQRQQQQQHQISAHVLQQHLAQHQNPRSSTHNSHPSPEGNFPAEVNAVAIFRCLRVSSLYNETNEYAYQTSVNIGGHVFKGILYNQGPAETYNYTSSTTAAADHQSSSGHVLHEHHNLLNSDALTDSLATTTSLGLEFPVNLLPPNNSSPLTAFFSNPQFFSHSRS